MPSWSFMFWWSSALVQVLGGGMPAGTFAGSKGAGGGGCGACAASETPRTSVSRNGRALIALEPIAQACCSGYLKGLYRQSRTISRRARREAENGEQYNSNVRSVRRDPAFGGVEEAGSDRDRKFR